ncbi:O-antigen ligase family protein [Kushneria indalinina]|uniref:O-antigen ligase-like membrane protein n=1 Tax=Kushneria indalinina DSM 14324 TaxID=1122140 RepID=A0A3D9DU80_9GAMM|nr:O-antigen ligase family protein [Kushneria indalinina]REC94287.1 O-antigen ligase-like membrane protein [Kushneria indalinina DSM 14324]
MLIFNNKLRQLIVFFYIALYCASTSLANQYTDKHTAVFYSNTIFSLLSFLVFVFLYSKQNIRGGLQVGIIGLCIILLLSPVYLTSGSNWAIAYFICFSCMAFVFSTSDFDLKDYSSCLVFSYFLIVFLSVFNYFFGGVSGVRSLNYTEIDFFGWGIKSIYGFEGSTANLGGLTPMVFLVSIFYSKGVVRFLGVFISSIIIFWTATDTPWVAIFFSVLIFLLPLTKGYKFSMIVAGFLIFCFSIVLYGSIPNWVDNEVPKSQLTESQIWIEKHLREGTNGRVEIWTKQIDSIANNYGVSNYFFGGPDYAVVPIRWGEGTTENPHNSYINMFFNAGALGVGGLMVLFYFISIGSDKKEFSLFVSLLVAGMTSSDIFYPKNPYYFIMLALLFAASLKRLYKQDVSET